MNQVEIKWLFNFATILSLLEVFDVTIFVLWRKFHTNTAVGTEVGTAVGTEVGTEVGTAVGTEVITNLAFIIILNLAAEVFLQALTIMGFNYESDRSPVKKKKGEYVPLQFK